MVSFTAQEVGPAAVGQEVGPAAVGPASVGLQKREVRVSLARKRWREAQ
jgi:hypothetical protein